MGLCSNHNSLYFDSLNRTKKSETVQSLIFATYYAEGTDSASRKADIAKRLVEAYNTLKGDSGSYNGDISQFSSQYTIGHEMGIWKNSLLELTDMAILVAQNKITIRDYFDCAFLNYIQPVNNKIVHLLYHLLQYMLDNNLEEITKDQMADAYMKVADTTERGNINGAFNMLLGSNYFIEKNASVLQYCGKDPINVLYSKCNKKYVELGYENAKLDLNTQEKYASYLLYSQSQNSHREENVKINGPLQSIYYGAPGTSKSTTIKKETEDKGKEVHRITFHPDTDYSSFVGCYKPTKSDGKDTITYEFVAQTFTKAYVSAWRQMSGVRINRVSHKTHLKMADKDGSVFTIVSIDNDKIVTTKDMVLYKSNISIIWDNCWTSGKFITKGKWQTVVEWSILKWIVDNNASITGSDFEIAWDILLDALKDNNEISVSLTEKSKVYTISYETEDSVHVFSPDSTNNRFTIVKNYEACNITPTSAVKCLQLLLKERDENNFDHAWEMLYNEKNGNACVSQANVSAKEVFLIIEEINRGNCAQIFGDIFQLLDRKKNGYSDYLIEADSDLQKYLAKEFADCEGLPDDIKSGQKMQLPPNMLIWATMNTSDQSLFPMDSAFKRRWEWSYQPIEEPSKDEDKMFLNLKETFMPWIDVIRTINQYIKRQLKSSDKQIGYWFVKSDCSVACDKDGNLVTDPNVKRKGISIEQFRDKVLFYLFDDVFKDDDTFTSTLGKSEDYLFVDLYEESDLTTLVQKMLDEMSKDAK